MILDDWKKIYCYTNGSGVPSFNVGKINKSYTNNYNALVTSKPINNSIMRKGDRQISERNNKQCEQKTQTTTRYWSLHTQCVYTQDWIFTTRCLFCLAHANSLVTVLRVECSRFWLLDNYIATLLLFVYCVHIACCCVLAHLSIPFSFTLIHDVVGLLVNEFVVVVGLAFVNRFNFKRWYSISIFVTIY